MQYQPLGRTGIQVSRLGLGTMVLGAWGNTDLADCTRIINRALDDGINLIDTADMYGDGENEGIVGSAIKTRRDEVVLCTKFHYPVGDDPDPNRRGKIADGAGVSVTHLALAWTLEHPAITTALIGPRTMDQLEDLLGAAELTLKGEVLDLIDDVVPPGHDINPADKAWIPPGLSTHARRRS